MNTEFEKKLLAWREKPIFLNLLCLIAALLLAYVFATVSGLPLKKVAKGVGNMGVICALICLAYYIAREAIVRTRKQRIKVDPSGEDRVRTFMMKLRAVHHIAGTMMLYLIVIHGSLMYAAGVSLRTSRMLFGGLTLLGLLAMVFLGFSLIKKPALRVWHRYVFLGCFITYLLHLALKFKF